ncbi:MAG: VOC family protein [Actinomycetota bacterium]|nr:VOC family protein [Actinomycetota bacterium]
MLDSADFAAIVPVSDIGTAVEFYEGKLGLRLVRRRDALRQNREAELSAGSGSLLLYESVGAGKSGTRSPASAWVTSTRSSRRSGSAVSSSRSTTCPT